MSQIENDLLGFLPTAEQARQKINQAKAQKQATQRRNQARAAAEKEALLERLQKPSNVSDAQALKKVTSVIQRAVSNGLTGVEVYRFPSKLCTDLGIAINNQHAGWEETLVGIPKEIHQFWKRHLRDRGYRLTCGIVDFPNGALGDVSMSLNWDN